MQISFDKLIEVLAASYRCLSKVGEFRCHHDYSAFLQDFLRSSSLSIQPENESPPHVDHQPSEQMGMCEGCCNFLFAPNLDKEM